jgi:hypothetical protein
VDDDEDIEINDDGKEEPNDSVFYESQPQNTNPTIGRVSTSIIIRVSQSYTI